MIIKSEQDMLEFGENFAKNCPHVIELVGDVGAGKTTFTRGLAEGLGITSEITSPSFTISKSYALPDGKTLIHYDFYRLSDPGLMVDDLAENLADDSKIVIIEWGESVANLLPENHTIINIQYTDDNFREVTIK
ncbi:tRNA (adenosine(37)-N6)-threonylcarbamoyltransferase complex ATPase subunit type 1 TsaE [Candidatus Saccharibacteria bacterium]|nr:tRNA (adenosine(37)-N6)-threonylcarbamoyltransferase complex ATPase subunit type 1 TsaE [Candidatus Saccharibacteria bacterium]